MCKKYSFKDVKQYIEVDSNSDCKLKSEYYINNKEKLELTCKCGNVFLVSFSNFLHKNKRQCNLCSLEIQKEKYKLTYNYVKEYIENFEGYKLLSTEYINNHEYLLVECPLGHIYKSSFNNFKTGKRCPHCAGNARKKGNDVYQEFIERGYIPQFKPEDYKNCDSNLPYICSKHLDKGVLYIDYAHLKQGKGCYYCGLIKIGDKKRHDGKYVFDEFIRHNLTPCFLPEDYIGYYQLLPFICPKHKNKEVQYVNFANLLHDCGCRYCTIEKVSGKNNYRYIGNRSLVQYLRDHLKEWKNDTIKQSKSLCVISGKKFEIIHHLYGFNFILNELLEVFNLKIKENISDYTDNELKLLTEKCLELHYKYGLGVCLTKEIHNLFHHIYGYGNNTPEQFEEFRNKYNNSYFENVVLGC